MKLPRLLLTVFLAVFFLLGSVTSVVAADFTSTVRGRILLDVQQNGEAWYVDPIQFQRYFLGRPDDAFRIMRDRGLGISNADLALIPEAGSVSEGNLALRTRLSGRILLQVEAHGEAWYVSPVTKWRYYLGRPADAFRIMSDLGLGITSADLARIPIATASLQPAQDESASFRSFTLTNTRGSFPLSVVTLRRDRFEMVTDTAEVADCSANCAAKSLETYVFENAAFAGIHGTYFCPPDYPDCAEKTNTFLPPVYNTKLNRLINEDTLKFFNRPMIATSTDGRWFFFHRAPSFGSVGTFEQTYDTELFSAIGNWPSLVEQGLSVAASEPSEPGFLVKSTRGGIGWNDTFVYLVIAQNATMEDFASVFISLEAVQAMNLDGGGSTALYFDDAYRVDPGRNLPNAILFRRK